MPRKKFKKYEQTVATPYWEVSQGTKLATAIQAIVAKLFGVDSTRPLTPREIIDYHLTTREREVAYLAALGFSDKEIADALVMNFQTVRVHLRNALNKMQLDDVGDLQRYFLDRRG